jgi:hypothetical protein
VRHVAARALASPIPRRNTTPPALRLREAADPRAQSPAREVHLPIRVLQVFLVPQLVRTDALVRTQHKVDCNRRQSARMSTTPTRELGPPPLTAAHNPSASILSVPARLHALRDPHCTCIANTVDCTRRQSARMSTTPTRELGPTPPDRSSQPSASILSVPARLHALRDPHRLCIANTTVPQIHKRAARG